MDTAGLSGGQLLTAAARVGSVVRRAEAVRLHLLAEVEAVGAATATGARSTAAWLRLHGEHPGAAKRDVELARKLAAHERVAQALGTGVISRDHAGVITGATEQLPAQVRGEAEQRLVGAATRMDPTQLAKEAVRVLTDLHPDGPARLEHAEQAATATRELSVVPDRARRGFVFAGRLDVEGAAILDTALNALAAPRPSTAAGPDPRTPGQRLGDALVELARRSLTYGDLPDTGGLRPQVVVTMTLDQLRGTDPTCPTLTGARLDEPLSAAAARRIACDAAIIPAVLGGTGEVLDYGRARRTASPAQRKALAIRDGGCAFPGCDRPPPWTDAHHIRHWANDGATDLDNLVLLCGAHHDTLHHTRWTVTIGRDRRPRFHPPRRT
jgi:hypothetical protein